VKRDGQWLSENGDVSMTGLFDSGKSTQVPAFILEDQLSRGKACKVYCAEPRRISAISLAQRVSLELGDSPGAVGTPASLVGYSIRLENNISRNTRLAYITYGIAIRMLEAGKQGESGITFDEITVGRIRHFLTRTSSHRIIFALHFSTSSSMRYCVVSFDLFSSVANGGKEGS
jgi:hypothetical protein